MLWFLFIIFTANKPHETIRFLDDLKIKENREAMEFRPWDHPETPKRGSNPCLYIPIKLLSSFLALAIAIILDELFYVSFDALIETKLWYLDIYSRFPCNICFNFLFFFFEYKYINFLSNFSFIHYYLFKYLICYKQKEKLSFFVL